MKPVASCAGKGIFVTTDFNKISKKNQIVSKFISNPLLINGYKFDLRIYVAITSFKPLRIYMYNEGLVRFATETYNDDGTKFS